MVLEAGALRKAPCGSEKQGHLQGWTRMRSSPRAVSLPATVSHSHSGGRVPARYATRAVAQPPVSASCGCMTRRPGHALAAQLLYSVTATLLANSSGGPRACTKSMLCARSRRGEKSRSLCRRKAGHTAASSGNSARAMASSRGRSRGATQYHTCAARPPGLAPAARGSLPRARGRAEQCAAAAFQQALIKSHRQSRHCRLCGSGFHWPAGDTAGAARAGPAASRPRALGAPQCR